MTTEACGFWSNGGCEGTAACPPRCPRYVDPEGRPYLLLPAEEAEIDAAVEMYRGYDPDHRSMGLPPTRENRIREWLERLHRRGSNFLAWEGDQVVGHAGYSPDHGDVPEFVVFVDPDYHGRGLGTELAKHAVAYAADAGHEGIHLYVSRTNEAAIHVYRKLGFEVVEDSGSELQMQLPLSAPLAESVQLAPADRARI